LSRLSAASGHRRLLAVASALTLAGVALIYLMGALHAKPGDGFARNDFDVLRSWKITGRLGDHPTEPAHLTKPGYILYLALVLPHTGEDPGEVRRFLILNAIWIVLGIAVAAWALWKISPLSALLFLLVSAFPPLRDSADYVLTEPISTGLGLMFLGGLLGWGNRPAIRAILGTVCAAILLLRPNLGWLLVAIALIVIASKDEDRKSGIVFLLGGFLAAVLVLAAIAQLTRIPINPLAVNTSKALLWGTADYYWPEDIGPWPVGSTPRESATLQIARARERWLTLLRQNPHDRWRAIFWRLTHSLLSQEELPSRWMAKHYLAVDQSIRRWWWIGAILMIAAAAAAALDGRGPWRFVPALIVAASIAQGVAFGADPRFCLVFLPLLAFSLVLALPSVARRRRVAVACAITTLSLLVVIRVVPDTVASDYAIVRGANRVLSQHIDRSRFPSGPAATVHIRVLKLRPFPLGLEVTSKGTSLFRREPSDSSPYPPYLTIELARDLLDEARRYGLTLQIRTLGASSLTDAFLYYPVVPASFGSVSTIDGNRVLPSAYGGTTAGGIAVWVHAGHDPVLPIPGSGDGKRAASTSVRTGKSVIAMRRKAPSTAYIGSNEETEKARQ